MIVDLFLIITGTVISIFISFFIGISNLMTAALPADQIQNAITYFLMPLANFRQYYNIADTLTAIVWGLTFFEYFLLFLGFRWLWAHVPWLGTHNNVQMFQNYGGEYPGQVTDDPKGYSDALFKAKAKLYRARLKKKGLISKRAN